MKHNCLKFQNQKNPSSNVPNAGYKIDMLFLILIRLLNLRDIPDDYLLML